MKQNNNVNDLLKILVKLTKDASKGLYGPTNEIFELTKTGLYPQLITELSESFGMMIVKVEAREYHLEGIIENLTRTQEELAAAKKQLALENKNLKKNLRERFSPGRIVGQSRQTREMLQQMEKIADSPINVLITGETGTGKELIAKTIHYNSSRSDKPFIAINCAALPETLIESELFGIEKGVATGVEKRIGKIEQANGGTLFLDEIGDLPLTGQAKILRVIEERELDRVGGRETIPVNIRIIAATNKGLKEEVKEGNFREDLFYRLNVVGLHLHPLRERQDDIPVLLDAFLATTTRKFGRPSMRFSQEALDCLTRYHWPGNIRELENEVERAVALAYSDTISPENLSKELRQFKNEELQATIPARYDNLEEIERETIVRVLGEVKWNKSEAARRLGLSREGLRKKLKRYGIAPAPTKEDAEISP